MGLHERAYEDKTDMHVIRYIATHRRRQCRRAFSEDRLGRRQSTKDRCKGHPAKEGIVCDENSLSEKAYENMHLVGNRKDLCRVCEPPD